MSTIEERAAALEANYSNLKDDVGEIKTDVKSILANINQGRGAWKTALIGGGAAGGIISALAAYFGARGG